MPVLKEVNPDYSLEGLMLKLQDSGHLMRRADSLDKTLTLGKTEDKGRGQRRVRWLDGTADSVDTSLSKLQEIVEDGSLACCSPWGHKDSRRLSDGTRATCVHSPVAQVFSAHVKSERKHRAKPF